MASSFLTMALAWIYNDLRERIGVGALVSEKEKDELSFAREPIVQSTNNQKASLSMTSMCFRKIT